MLAVAGVGFGPVTSDTWEPVVNVDLGKESGAGIVSDDVATVSVLEVEAGGLVAPVKTTVAVPLPPIAIGVVIVTEPPLTLTVEAATPFTV